MGGRGAVPVAIALGLGMALARSGSVTAVLELAIVLLLVVVAHHAPPRWATLLLLAAVVLGAASRQAAHRDRLERGRALLASGRALVRVNGRVCEPPSDAAQEPIAIVAIDRAEPPLPSGARLRLRCPAGTRLEWSDRVAGLAWIDPPDPPRNPGGFDGRRFADANALLGSGRFVWCRPARATRLGSWPRATFGRMRTALERRLATRLAPQARRLVWPLVLGDRSDMPVALGAELRVSGLVHLIALSGLHVSWLAQLVRTFAAAMGAGVRGRALAGVVCALMYVGLAGPIPSLARAAMSELVMSCAALSSRRLDPLQALALSSAAWLVVFPGWIDDLGFQLSCMATLGLVTIGSVTLPRVRVIGGAMRTLVATLGAQVTALPLLLASFHLLPWLAPVANLLAVPVAGWLLGAAWLALIADVAVPGLGTWWYRACEALAAAFEKIVESTANIPGAARATGHEPIVIWVAAAGALLLAWSCSRRRPPAAEPWLEPPSRSAIVGATLCACALLLAAWGSERRPPAGRVWLVVLDVGQGDAIALGFSDGWWLVDAGPRAPRFDAGEQVVLPFLRWAGVQELRGLAITHDDSDHSGGVPAVQRGVAIDRVIVPAAIVGLSPRAAGTPSLARFRGRPARLGRVLHATPSLTVAWPPADSVSFTQAPRTSADNAGGLVLVVGDGLGRSLLMADVDSTVEARLDVDAPVGVLKVGHHGSATSSGATWLAHIRPRFAVVSCGRRNRFGHPDSGAIARLRAAGAAIERTDASGARWFELDDSGAWLIDWAAGEPKRERREPEWPAYGARPPLRP